MDLDPAERLAPSMIVMIDADAAFQKFSGHAEPDRIQISLRVVYRVPHYSGIGMQCIQRWLITTTGETYYTDEPDDDWWNIRVSDTGWN